MQLFDCSTYLELNFFCDKFVFFLYFKFNLTRPVSFDNLQSLNARKIVVQMESTDNIAKADHPYIMGCIMSG